jgi:hypothetical protein
VTFLDDLIGAVRAHDAARPRSQQQSVGWSEVGGCRSYLAYRLKGEWPTDHTDTWGAIRGTAIHEMLGQALAGREGVHTELSTSYRDIPGHADLVVIKDNSLSDFQDDKPEELPVLAAQPRRHVGEAGADSRVCGRAHPGLPAGQ